MYGVVRLLPQSNFQTFPSTPEKIFCPYAAISYSPLAHVVPDLFSISRDLPFLNILYTLNHTIHGLCLAFFTQHNVF